MFGKGLEEGGGRPLLLPGGEGPGSLGHARGGGKRRRLHDSLPNLARSHSGALMSPSFHLTRGRPSPAHPAGRTRWSLFWRTAAREPPPLGRRDTETTATDPEDPRTPKRRDRWFSRSTSRPVAPTSRPSSVGGSLASWS